MDELIKQLEMFKDMTTTFTIWDVALALVLSFVLSLFVGWVYKITHRGISYTQSYVQTMVLMAVVISLIMLIIGSNIARAFSLVGALSIIRFRNAVKETRDVGFIFLAMAIGMACGTKFYLLAIMATITICCFILIMSKLDLFAREIRERILMVQVPEDFPHEAEFERSFGKYFSDVALISVETVRGNLIGLIYSVTMKGKFRAEDFLKEMRKVNNGHKVTLIEGQQQVDL